MEPGQTEGFAHRWVSGHGGVVLLLLHGTGGSENDLLDLGRTLRPGASLLSPRGKVLENGKARFFRRIAEGVFDEEDLVRRTRELADFVGACAAHFRFEKDRVIAVGYSNGANIAASMMLLRADVLSGAVLMRAMLPLIPSTLPDLGGKPVLLMSGRADPLVPSESAARLARLLADAGGDVTHEWSEGGHQVGAEEIESARRWLAESFA